MPDDADAQAADGKEAPSDDNLPDIVGEELGDGAHIWRVYDRVARDEDRERVGTWNRGLDNLALFAGLFSAVTTAFIIESQQNTEPDYARLTFLVLNASAAGIPFVEEPFTIDRSVRVTNCLWIASLMLSLTAALIAIMGKDWIGMYASRPACNPRQWAEIRTYRLACVDRWYMSGVIASAPVLLHVSLVLFAAGLVIFVAPDPFSQRVALGLGLVAGGIYLVTALSAVIFPTSPFKSPATQAIRSAVCSIFTSLFDRLVSRPKRHPVQLLQQASLLAGAMLVYPLADLLPLDRSRRRRLRTGDVGLFWNHLFSSPTSDSNRSWGGAARLLAKSAWARTTTFASSLPGLLRSALDDYHYRRQRPHPRPWHVSLRSFVAQIDLSDHWVEVRSQPTPEMMAQALSHLNAISPSTDAFYSILVALGDISIGRQVAPLVSFDLRSRLTTEIRHKWQRADLVTLSRFVLADRHLSDSALLAHQVCSRFVGKAGDMRSESIVFALVELGRDCFIPGSTVNHYFPDILIQPRGLQLLLPLVREFDVAIVLFQRYWDPAPGSPYIDFAGELRQRLDRLLLFGNENEVESMRRYIDRCDAIELLVFLLDYLEKDEIRCACALMFDIIFHVFAGGKHLCLVYAFGHENPETADAAWSAVPVGHASTDMRHHIISSSLPLANFAAYESGERDISRISDGHPGFEVCLARTVVRLIYPSRYFVNSLVPLSDDSDAKSYVSTLELCVRCIHTQLSYFRSRLEGTEKSEIIALLLQHSVLIRVCSQWDHFYCEFLPTTEQNSINILTIIARHLTGLLASGATDDRETGARLFPLLSFSAVVNYDGQNVAWELGSYLRTAAARSSEQDPGKATSLRRLLSAIRALRPFCVQSDNLRAAWDRIGLAADDEYKDPFWDAENFELGNLALDPPSAGMEGVSDGEDAVGHGSVAGAPEDCLALHWLDGAMH